MRLLKVNQKLHYGFSRYGIFGNECLFSSSKHTRINHHDDKSSQKSFCRPCFFFNNSPLLKSELINKQICQKFSDYFRIMRLNKAQAVWFVAAPGLWGLGFATPPGMMTEPILLFKFILGSFFVRSAECVINDIIDVNIDKEVERTKTRPLADGRLEKSESILLATLLLSNALSVLLSLPWSWYFYLFKKKNLSFPYGLIGAAGLFIYPYMKKVVKWPGIPLSVINCLGLPMAYSASGMAMNFNVVFPLAIAYITYTAAYEAMYSFQDLKDDRRLNIQSSARYVGLENTKLKIGSLMLTSTVSLLIAGYFNDQTFPFYLSLLASSGLLAKNLKEFSPLDTSNIFPIFNNNMHICLLLTLGCITGSYLKKKNDENTLTEEIIT